MSAEKIKPCPFCGSKEVNFVRSNPRSCWIECQECLGRAEAGMNRIQALVNWNHRPKTSGYAAIVLDDDQP